MIRIEINYVNEIQVECIKYEWKWYDPLNVQNMNGNGMIQ